MQWCTAGVGNRPARTAVLLRKIKHKCALPEDNPPSVTESVKAPRPRPGPAVTTDSRGGGCWRRARGGLGPLACGPHSPRIAYGCRSPGRSRRERAGRGVKGFTEGRRAPRGAGGGGGLWPSAAAERHIAGTASPPLELHTGNNRGARASQTTPFSPNGCSTEWRRILSNIIWICPLAPGTSADVFILPDELIVLCTMALAW